MISILSDLQGQIRQCELMVLYYQNQILEKTISINQLLNLKEIRSETQNPQIVVKNTSQLPTVPKMVCSVIPDLPTEFYYPDVIKAVFEKFSIIEPEDQKKVKRCIYPAIYELQSEGKIERCPGGFKNKHA